MESNHYLIDFYKAYDEDGRLQSKHGSVEFLTTIRYVERYLKPRNHILEIGSGTGRYSHVLARRGYVVDAVELVEHNIEVFRKNTLPNEQITISQGNALDLSAFSDNQYDVTLLLGPLYHLYTQEDKRQVVREAIRVTKQGGIIFAAYVISDGCLIRDFTGKISMLQNMCEQGFSTLKPLPQNLSQRIYLNLCGKKMLTKSCRCFR